MYKKDKNIRFVEDDNSSGVSINMNVYSAEQRKHHQKIMEQFIKYMVSVLDSNRDPNEPVPHPYEALELTSKVRYEAISYFKNEINATMVSLLARVHEDLPKLSPEQAGIMLTASLIESAFSVTLNTAVQMAEQHPNARSDSAKINDIHIRSIKAIMRVLQSVSQAQLTSLETKDIDLIINAHIKERRQIDDE